MLRRFGWILRSLFSRPLVLALWGGGLVFGCLILIPASTKWKGYQTNFPPLPRPGRSVDSQASLDAVRSEGRQAAVESINLNYLWADMQRKRQGIVPQGSPGKAPQARQRFKPPGDEFFRVVDEFPNLRSVQLSFYGTAVGAEKVARLPKLESLALDGVVFGETVDVSWLREAKRLKYLEMQMVRPLSGLAALRDLPQFETLSFRTRFEVSDAVLAEAAELPHLKTLILALYPGVGDQEPLTDKGFAALAGSKSLQQLFVGGWDPKEQVELMAMARRGAGRLQIGPALVVQESPLSFFVLYPAGILAAAVGLGLSTWFRGPTSRLAPRFALSHLAVAAVLGAAIVAVTAWRVTALGNNLLAATIVSTAVVTTACMMASGGVIEAQMAQRQRARRWVLWLKQALFFFLLGSLVVPTLTPRILRGEMPWMLAALGLVAAASMVLIAVTLRNLANATDIVGAPAGEKGLARTMRQMQFRPNWMFSPFRREAQIGAWAASPPEWTWWKRVERWRAGNPPLRTTRQLILMLALALPVMWLFMRAMANNTNNTTLLSFDVMRGQVLFMGGLMVLGGAAGVAMVWRTRLLTLPLESLRPCERRAMQNEMAAGLVADLLPTALLLAALEAIGVNLNSAWQVAWWRVPGDFALVVACALPLLMGVSGVMVVVKREWLMAAIVMTLPVAIVFGVVGMAYLQYGDAMQTARESLPRMLLLQLWIAGILGVGMAGWMYRRWRSMEIGSRA